MLPYIALAVLIGLWLFLVIWIKYKRWQLKRAEEAAGEDEEGGAPKPGAAHVAETHVDLEAIHLPIGRGERSAYYEQPEVSGPQPLLLCFHGGLGSSIQFAETSNLSARAQAWGYLAVFPDAEEGWVDGRPERGSGTEDIEFVVKLIDHLKREQLIDPARIFAVGVSNGGFFVQHFATQRPGLLAGGASVLASIPTATVEASSHAPAMPFMMACDVTDGIMPFAGGEIASAPGLGVGGHVIPAQDARALWVARNGAGPSRPAKRVNASDGNFADIYDHPAGGPGAPVRFVEIYGMGHRWPRWPGIGSTEVNAADFALEFFASRAVQDFAVRSFQEHQRAAHTG